LKPTCCDSGFSAACGWDPVTGWGSIAFPSLLAMFVPQNITTDFYESSNYLNTSTYYPAFCVESVEATSKSTLSSIAAVIIVTASILLLIFLFAALVSYIVFVCRAQQLSSQRVHPNGDSGGSLYPYTTVPIAAATVVSTAPTAVVLTAGHVRSACTEASSPSFSYHSVSMGRRCSSPNPALHEGVELITVTATAVPVPIPITNPRGYIEL
jgi:hypothetical protein